MIVPMVNAIYLSFTSSTALSVGFNSKFVFLDNYRYMFQDKDFLQALFNTLKLMLVIPAVTIFLSLVFAFILTQGQLKEKSFYRTVFFFPSIVSMTKKNEGFKTSGQVQYVAQTGNFKKKGLEYTGALEILKVILSYDYLWMNLRVKGGAYGCMSGFKRNGESYLVSYRDPHLKRTLDVYKGIPDYIRNFQADEREMTKYIIGTISGKDVPRTPQMKGSVSKTAYFCGVTEEMLQKERDQILNASAEDIHALAEIIEAVLAADQICVVGSESKVAEASDVLMEVKPLINC